MDFLRTLLQPAVAQATQSLRTSAAPPLLLDIGANIGGHTHLMRQHVPLAYIHAFEPIPAVRAEARARHANDALITIWPLGLSDHSYVAEGLACHEAWTLDTPAHAVRGRNAVSIERDGPGTLPPIPFTTVDHFLLRWPQWGTRPAFIKIDTDGYEYRVLQGARYTLLESRPTVLLEVGYLVEDLGDTVPALLDLIYDDLRYVLIEQDGRAWPTKAVAAQYYPHHTTMDVAMIPVELSTTLEYLD